MLTDAITDKNIMLEDNKKKKAFLLQNFDNYELKKILNADIEPRKGALSNTNITLKKFREFLEFTKITFPTDLADIVYLT